jgi:hypothetical protein
LLHLAPPRRRRCHLVLPLRLLRQLRAAPASSHHCVPVTAVEAFSADPSDDNAWWCTLPRTSGIGNTSACHRPRGVLANSGPSRPSAPDCINFDIDPLFRLPRRVAVFVPGGFPFAPPSSRRLFEHPRLPVRLLTLGNLDSSTSTTATLRTASSTTDIHPPSWLRRHRHKGLPSA